MAMPGIVRLDDHRYFILAGPDSIRDWVLLTDCAFDDNELVIQSEIYRTGSISSVYRTE